MHDMAGEMGPGGRSTDDPAAAQRSAAAWRRARSQIAAILAVGATVIAALWLIIAVAIHTERRAAVEHARSEANNLTAAFRAEVAGKLETIARAMDVIAAEMRLDADLNLHSWAQHHPLLGTMPIQSAAILSPAGRLLSATTDPHPEMLDLSDRDYYSAVLHESGHAPYVSQVVAGRISRTVGIKVSRRVEADDGRLLGVLVFSVAPSQLTTLPKSADLGPRSLLALVGTDNVIRARFIAHDENGTLGAGTPVPPLPPRDGAPVQSFIRVAAVDHVVRLFSVRDVPGYPLYVTVGFDLTQILQPATAHAILIGAIGIIATLVLAGLMALLVTEIHRRTDREVKLAEEQIRLAGEVHLGQQIQQQLQSSRARLQDFAVMASDWFWEQDSALRFTDVGVDAPYPVSDGRSHLGKTRWDLAGAYHAQEWWDEHKRDLLERKPFREFRYSLFSHDGELHHVSINGVPVHDGAGQFVGYRGTGRDITMAVKAETELRVAKERAEQAETLLRDAVDSISEGFVIYDREDRLVMCNARYRQAYPEGAQLLVPGARFEDIVRHILAARGYPDARGREEEWIAANLRRHRAADGAVEQRASDGSWILMTDRRMKNGGVAGLRIDITALKQAQTALQESEARLDRAQAIAGIGSWELDLASGRYIGSKEMFRICGLSADLSDQSVGDIVPFVQQDDYPALQRWLAELAAGNEPGAHETRLVRPGGEMRMVQAEGRAVVDPDGVIRRLIGTAQDVTDRRMIERQLAQAQKMEAIGRLTGGMAHDFNNGLGVIIGNLDLLGRLVQSDPTVTELCNEARAGALRCADLVQRLLAFARRQPLHPQQTNVNALVENMARLLSRTLGEDIILSLELGDDLGSVATDPAQLEAALTNLANNARDAMPRGGRLQIATTAAELDADYAALHPEASPGCYIVIEVSDTGIGIAPDIIGRIFEPFFTTKEPGKGTGLGLSMVFGFARQSGGHVAVYSEPDLGTTFRLYLPRAEIGDRYDAGDAEPASVSDAHSVGGNETVLVVEDNAPLRAATARQLEGLGYHVLEAGHAAAALATLSGDHVDLLFTDVVMPGTLDGLDLADRAVALHPGLKVLLTSGFPRVRGGDKRVVDSPFPMLNKPYRRDELARTVRELLDASAARAMNTATRRFALADGDLYDDDGAGEGERP
jgi:PAS domain S-box-containing protein